MSKYFDNSHEWEEKDKEFLGLPRPHKVLTDSYIKKVKNRFLISKKIPIPWQSKPILDEVSGLAFNVIKENESIVFKQSLCAYCGIKINNDEFCTRWTVSDMNGFIINNKSDGPRVFSDFHPFHINCMNEARTFCPFMKKLKENDFQYGEFKQLQKNAKFAIAYKIRKTP
jgi:hypothetical protein